MALFAISDKTALNFRFPLWEVSLYYPINSVVMFDVNDNPADSEVEYHLFIAIKDVIPTRDDPRLSVFNNDGNWQDINGREIDDISSVSRESDSEVIVSLTIEYDDGTTTPLTPFNIPIPAASTTQTVDLGQIGIYINNGVLQLGADIAAAFTDSDEAKAGIRTFLNIRDSRLIWDFNAGEDRYELKQFYKDDGTLLNILSTGITSFVGQQGEFFWVSGEDQIMPFLPSWSFTALNSGSENAINLPWDQAATGFTARLVNPDNLAGSFIQPNILDDDTPSDNDAVTLTLGLYDLTLTGDSEVGVSTWIYRPNETRGSTLRPNVATVDRDTVGGNIAISMVVNQKLPGVPPSPAPSTVPGDRPITFTWRTPQHDRLTFTKPSSVNFLDSYTSVPYTAILNSAHISNPNSANITHDLVDLNGNLTTLTPLSGVQPTHTGFATFPSVTRDNVVSTVSYGIRLDTQYRRPVGVATEVYTISDSESESFSFDTDDFTYPSFWFVRDGFVDTLPAPSSIVDTSTTNNFASDVNLRADSPFTSLPSTLVLNPGAGIVVGNDDEVLWFAVRQANPQPNQYQLTIGSFVNPVTLFTDSSNAITITPDVMIQGTNTPQELYTLYGYQLGVAGTTNDFTFSRVVVP